MPSVAKGRAWSGKEVLWSGIVSDCAGAEKLVSTTPGIVDFCMWDAPFLRNPLAAKWQGGKLAASIERFTPNGGAENVRISGCRLWGANRKR